MPYHPRRQTPTQPIDLVVDGAGALWRYDSHVVDRYILGCLCPLFNLFYFCMKS